MDFHPGMVRERDRDISLRIQVVPFEYCRCATEQTAMSSAGPSLVQR